MAVQFRGETRDFLGSPAGSATFNVLKMAREGLLLPLKDALEQTRRTNERVRKAGVRVRKDRGGYRSIDLEVTPLHDRGSHVLVVFEDREVSSGTAARHPHGAPGSGTASEPSRISSRSFRRRRSTSSRSSRSRRRPTKSSRPPTRRSCRPTRSCNPPTKSSKLPRRSSSRLTRS